MIKPIYLSLLLMTTTLFAEMKWNAQWIMHPTLQPQAHGVVLFRKNIELRERPAKYVIHVSADNHYRLFVNGHYLGRGPARGDLHHWFYETYDIAPHLRKGSNTIAAEVINWGPKRSFTYFSQMTSFLVQADSDQEKSINTCDGAWRCLHNTAVHAKPVDWIFDRNTIDFGLYVGNPTDSVAAALYPWGWEQHEYDDRHWPWAKWCDVPGARNSQHAGGILYGNGKLLIPRRTGMVVEKKERFARVARTRGVEKNDDFIQGRAPFEIPANRKVSILLDFDHETVGYPEMIISAGKDAHIQIMYGENLIVKNKSPKGNRNEIDGKYLIGLKDVFIPDGGNRRVFKPSYLRAFRFVQLDIQTCDEALRIEDYCQMASMAPIDLRAVFETDDSFVNSLMPAGWRTASICSQDILMSDAAYEQMQYVGDSRVHNLTLLTLSGDDRLTRNSLIQFNESRIPEGLTWACYPNAFHLIIPSYSLIWIDEIHDYMMWRDDKEFVRQFDLGIRNVLEWFENRRQAKGLLGKMEWWPALAWPRHYKNGVPPEMSEGNNTLYTLHYAYTLRHAAEIMQFIGNQVQAKVYRERADEICRTVNRLCKSADGFYREAPGHEKISQITNIMAILAGAVQGAEARALMLKLLEPKDWFGQVDLFLHLYLFEALNETGLQDRFLPELSEWRTMLERGMTTFAEVPLEWGEENQRSECHPWSTAPNHFFFRTICGITPMSRGHRKVDIKPVFGSLNSINARYPHPLGAIEMRLQRKGEGVEGSITVGAEMQAVLVWGTKKIKLAAGVNQVRL